MSAKFFALLTVIGANKLAKATALGTTLKITQMAVGDGGGTLPTPDTQQTKLVGEKRRAGLNTLFVDPKNDSQIIAEQVIPENEGGYWIREIGLFDDEGSLIAVGNCPETYKPQLQEGSGRTQTIRMILTVSHTESVELKVDPSVILATRESVNDAIESASKKTLKEVEETYATKEEVKKKFNIDNVVHEKGASKEKVISQFGVTELFQPKGNYQPAGNYALLSGASFTGPVYAQGEIGAYNEGKRVHLKAVDDGCSLAINDGNGYRSVQIPAKNGTMAFVGDSYTKTDSDRLFQPKGNYQPAGNYALKSGDSFTGAVYAAGEIGVYNGKNRTHLKPTESGCSLLTTIGSEYKEISIPHKSGTMVLMGDVYNRGESDLRFQPKGNYQPAGNYALLSGASFTGPVYAQGEIGAYNGRNRVHILAKNNKACLAITENEVEYFIIDFPNDNGTVALLSDIDKSNNIPVGSPIPWSLPTAPSGYLICQGQEFNKLTYPKLALAYPSGKLPDLRGNVIRGLDAGRGIDAERQILSEQAGNSLLSARGVNDSPEGGFEFKLRFGSVGTNNQGQSEIYQQKEGVNGQETRMRNIAFLYIVRAA